MNYRNKENSTNEKEKTTMTKKEMKEMLNEKCNTSWNVFRAMCDVYGENHVMTEKYRTQWITYDDLYLEFFNEEPKYKF